MLCNGGETVTALNTPVATAAAMFEVLRVTVRKTLDVCLREDESRK